MREEDFINTIIIILLLVIAKVAFLLGYYRCKKDIEDENKKIKLLKEKNKIAPQNYWNYRVATRLYKHPIHKEETCREFLIISCYYEHGKPTGYGESVKMSGWEEVEDLKKTNKLIELAFEKDIIDLDNFPKTFNL